MAWSARIVRWTHRLEKYVHKISSREQDTPDRLRSFFSLALRISILLVLSLGLEKLIKSTSLLPQSSYTHPVIFVELIKQITKKLFGNPIHYLGMGLGLIVAGFLAGRYPSFRQSCRSLFQGWAIWVGANRLRLWITSVAALLAWWFITYDYNLFFDHAHFLDRSLLIGLVLLIYWRPIFVLPFLIVLVSIIGQFSYPLGGYSWAAQDLPIRILILFITIFFISVFTGDRNLSDLIFMTCCLIATHYLTSGIGKLKLNWLIHNNTHFLLPSAYSNSWLNFLEAATVIQLTQLLSWFNWPMKVLTIILECGVLVCLWRWFLFRWFLLGWIGLHIGIFLISGICFWHWVVLESIFFLLFFWQKKEAIYSIFSWRYFVISWFLILGFSIGFQPVTLAWIDAPIAYTYRFEAIGSSGQAYNLSPNFFAPYDYQFILGDFSFLSDQPILRTFGSAIFQDNLFDDLKEVQSLGDIEDLEMIKGSVAFNSEKVNQFQLFCQHFISNWNRRHLTTIEVDILKSPPLLWTFPRKNAFTGQEPIVAIRIYQALSHYSETQYQTIRERKIYEIQISQHQED